LPDGEPLTKNYSGSAARNEELLLTNDSDLDKLHETQHHEGILRYSVNRPMQEEWKGIVKGIELIDDHIAMKNELQWPVEWARTFEE